MFDQKALSAAVKKTIAESPDIPADARGAFLTVADQDGVKAVIAVKMSKRWKVAAVVEHEWGEPVAATRFGVTVTGTFGGGAK